VDGLWSGDEKEGGHIRLVLTSKDGSISTLLSKAIFTLQFTKMSNSEPTYTSTILITGGTTGLGYHCALTLASQLPTTRIILASRTDTSSSAAHINTQTKLQNVQYMPLDLGSLSSVREFASRWTKADFPLLSALVLNAGIQLPGSLEYTPDQIEKHFGINHVAHALLFHLLTPHLKPDARIIVVSSGLHDPLQGKKWGIVPHYTTPARAANPNEKDEKESNGRDRYATSKAANAIWAFALGHHLSNSQHTVLAFDPGLMFGTSFARDASFLLRILNRYILPALTPVFRLLVNKNVNTPTESGANMAWLVMSEEVAGKKGVYFEKRKEREASLQARDEGVQEELWRWTIERVSRDDEEKGVFGRVE
jgi:NAD(P)-dependent dehydrogenase (short-subunit alcohol dehydrogenase family)